MVAKIDADEYSDLKDGIIEVQLDGEAPPQPSNIRVKGGNEALSVSWDAIERSAVDDMQGYVLFCSRDDKPVFAGEERRARLQPALRDRPDPVPGRRRSSRRSRCWRRRRRRRPVLAAWAPTARRCRRRCRSSSGASVRLHGLLTTQTSERLFRLQNHITYLVGVASVDDRGNVSDIERSRSRSSRSPPSTSTGTTGPRAAAAEGGFCAVAAPGRRAGGWLVVGLLAAGLALVAGAGGGDERVTTVMRRWRCRVRPAADQRPGVRPAGRREHAPVRQPAEFRPGVPPGPVFAGDRRGVQRRADAAPGFLR